MGVGGGQYEEAGGPVWGGVMGAPSMGRPKGGWVSLATQLTNIPLSQQGAALVIGC